MAEFATVDKNFISGQIISACFEVHQNMGPGLLESVYQACLCMELQKRRLHFISQMELPLHYKGQPLDKVFRIDLLVEQTIIVEIKAVEYLHPVYEAQILSYMKHANINLGLLINFNVSVMKEGIRRFIY